MSYISVTLTQYTKGCQRCGECFSISGNVTRERWDPSPTISLHLPLCSLLVRLERQEVGRSRSQEKPSRTRDIKVPLSCPAHISTGC